MKVKTGKGVRITDFCVFVVGIILFVLLGIYDEEFVMWSSVIWSLLFLRIWIWEGRTLIMTEEGCEVCFLCFKKRYHWEEMKVKRVEHYYTVLHKTNYTDAAFFSVRSMHKPSWYHAGDYGFWFHPFSFIFVYFIADSDKKNGGKYAHLSYSIDEDLFFEMMESWSVNLEDTRTGWYKRDRKKSGIK